MFWIFVLAVACCLTLMWFYYRYEQKKLLAIPVHFPSLPIIGGFYCLRVEATEMRKQYWDICYNRNPKAGIIAMMMGPWPFVLVYKAEYVQDVLNSHEIRKLLDYKFTKPWLGEGLITSHGHKWYSHRKMLTPSFFFNILNEFLPIMNQQAEIFLNIIEQYAISKAAFNIFPLTALLTLDVICETAMGTSLNAQQGDNKEYVQAVIDITKIIDSRFKLLHLWPELCFRFTSMGRRHAKCLELLHGLSRKVLDERIDSFDRSLVERKMTETIEENECEEDKEPLVSGHSKRLALLDTLLYASENFTRLSRKEIQEQIDTFLFAGHETTAICLSWTLYLLGRNLGAQRKVHEEVDRIFSSTSRPATLADLRQMKYIECCIKESLRMFPSVPTFARALENDLKVGPYTIPKGGGVIVLLEILNHDPDYFVDPFSFHPERFLVPVPEELRPRKTHPFSFVPFAAGPRNCIGQRFAMQELKVVISAFFRRFSVEFSKSSPQPEPVMELLFRPPDTGIFLHVNYR